MQHKRFFPAVLAFVLAVLVLVSGCAANAPQVTAVPPTKTPKPTFTPTSLAAPTRLIVPTATPAPTQVPPGGPATSTTAPAAAEATVEPTATTQQPAQLSAKQAMNVRQGPGTNYPTIGQLQPGTTHKVMAKNQDGSWLQFNFDGDPGWANAGLVSVEGDLEAVALAQNIPAAPKAQPVAQQPAPAAQPKPAAQPAQPAPTAVPQNQQPFMYVQGSAQPNPNGSGPYFEGHAQYKSGGAWNWVCVLMDHYGNRSIKPSGAGGKGDGNWGHSPGCNGRADCALGVFEFYVVECPKSLPEAGLTLEPGQPVPPIQSDKFIVDVKNLNEAGQWYNITFRSTQQ